MTPTDWLTDLGKAADELGYGITSIEPSRITLIQQQGDAEITVESHFLSGDFLRSHLKAIPHKSGTGYADAYQRTVGR